MRLFILFCLFVPQITRAATVSVGAALSAEGIYYADTLAPSVNQSLAALNGEITSSLKIGKGFLAKLRPTGHWDPANKSPSERSWWDVPEGYGQLKASLADEISASFRAGFDTFTWGVTDGFNPVDVVSARRFNDPLRSEKLGVLSTTLRLDFGFLLLEGIYIPRQRKSILPAENSRWLPREIGGDVATDGSLFHPPSSPTYYYRDPTEYNHALRDNWGARLSSHFLGMDAAAYYFNGAATVPAASYNLTGAVTRINLGGNPELEINADPAIGLRLLFHRVTVTGASLVIPVSELIFRGELAITSDWRRGSASIAEHNTEAVAELEHTFSWEQANLTALGLATYADPQETPGLTSSTPSLVRMFDRGVGAGLRWSPAPAWSAEGLVALDTKAGGHLLKVETNYALSDAWKLYATGEIFSGKSTTPIGVYRKNDRLMAGVRVAL